MRRTPLSMFTFTTSSRPCGSSYLSLNIPSWIFFSSSSRSPPASLPSCSSPPSCGRSNRSTTDIGGDSDSTSRWSKWPADLLARYVDGCFSQLYLYLAAMLSSSSCPTQQQYLSSGSNAQIFIMTSTTISLKWQQCSVLPSCLLQQYLPSSSNAQFFNMSSPRQVLTELERIPDSESSHQHTRKRKKKPRPSPIALEPCAG